MNNSATGQAWRIEVYSVVHDKAGEVLDIVAWHDLGEGPFDAEQAAKDYAEAEVGAPWRVVPEP